MWLLTSFWGLSSPISWPASQWDPWSRGINVFKAPWNSAFQKSMKFFVVVVLICSVLLWKWQGGCGTFRMLRTRILYLERKINLGTWVRGVWKYLPGSLPKSGWKVFTLIHLGIASSMTLRITDQKSNSTHMHTQPPRSTWVQQKITVFIQNKTSTWKVRWWEGWRAKTEKTTEVFSHLSMAF